MIELREVKIPSDVYEKIEERIKETEFELVDEYVTYVLPSGRRWDKIETLSRSRV